MKKRYLHFVLLSTFISLNVSSQDIHFSHQEFAPMTLNPAAAGMKYQHFASLIHRNQWASVTTPFVTTYAGYDQRIPVSKGRDKSYLVAGVNFYSDKAGDANMGSTSGHLSIGYHLRLAEQHTLGLALQPGLTNRSVDIAQIKWGTQYEVGIGYNSDLQSGEINPTNASFTHFNLNAGLVYSFKSEDRFVTINEQKFLNIGIALHHVNGTEFSYLNNPSAILKRRISIFADGQYTIPNTNLSILPGVYYNFQGKQQELLFGSYVRYLLQRESVYTGLLKGTALSLGVFSRLKDAMSLKILLEYQKYSIGFAYDINTSSLREASNYRGATEIVLKFAAPNPFGKAKNGANKSVKFL